MPEKSIKMCIRDRRIPVDMTHEHRIGDGDHVPGETAQDDRQTDGEDFFV